MTFIHVPALTTNATTSYFVSSISPGWVVMFLDSYRTAFTFLSWLDLLGGALAFWIPILKIFKSLQNYWHRDTDITSFEKHFLQVILRALTQIWWNIFTRIYFWRNLSPGVVRYRSFETYRIRFSQVFSCFLKSTQTEWFATKLCNFIIRNYIQTLLEIGTIVLSPHT